jgi:ribosomal protein L9
MKKKLSNKKGNMKEIKKEIHRVEEDKDSEIKRLNKVDDQLEQRISKLEKSVGRG